ncbi:MAG: hypothetical protein PF518_12475, partial [Spirochaetaceae bacterium]|nr:hypothetical protein [Spirochaetaceae bacterium]
LAMELDKIEPEQFLEKEKIEWLLKKEYEANREISTLYNNGQEFKNFIRSYNSKGFLSFYSESKNNIPEEEIDFRKDGQIQENRVFLKDGSLNFKLIYVYNENAELLQIDKKDEADNLISSIDYTLRNDGSIRSFNEYEEGNLTHGEIWNSFHGQLYMEQRQTEGKRDIVYYNEDNKVVKILQYDGENLISDEVYEYYSDGTEKLIIKTNFLKSEIIQISKNVDGLIIREEKFRSDLLLYVIRYSYSAGNLVLKEKSGSGLREKWLYTYENDQIKKEDYYKQGVLVQKKKYTDPDTNSYIIELYNNDEIFMNLIYEDDKKIREEFIEGGRIIRIKDLGDL